MNIWTILLVVGVLWWVVFGKARDAARESFETRSSIMKRGIASGIIGLVINALGLWAYSVMNKESPAPIIPFVLGFVVGGGLFLLSTARVVGAFVTNPASESPEA